MTHMMAAEHCAHPGWDTVYPHFGSDEYYRQNASEGQYPGWCTHYDYDSREERGQTGSPCVPSDSHWAYLTSGRLPVMRDDALGHASTTTTPQSVSCSGLYSDRSWQYVPSADGDMTDSARNIQFMSETPVSPTFPAHSALYKPLHTDEAFALMQRQSSNYIPSISVALDAPIRKSVEPICSPSRSPTPSPSDVSSPPATSQAESEPSSPVIKVEKLHIRETRSRSIKEARGKPDSPCLYTRYRARDGEAEVGESRSEEEDEVPLLPQVNSDTVEKAKRGLARSRRTQHLACYFCRRRKIACVAPDTTDPGRTCNQCERRGLSCSFPAESHRGLRHRSRDKKPIAQDEGTP